MFTGLIQDIGKIVEIQDNAEGREFWVESVLAKDLKVDDSVSINGACQTVVEKKENKFKVQAIHVTLEKTNFGEFRTKDEVNLELALRFGDRLGGHLVQGHVNGVSTLKSSTSKGENYYLEFSLEKGFGKYLCHEGSVTLDGISLTVADISSDRSSFFVSIIPHTWEKTILSNKKIGDKVNLEVDILAKYIENLIPHNLIGKSS